MVEMGMIRKERFTGVPLLLSADTFTETIATAVPTGGPREKVSWTDRGYHILHLVMRGPGDDDVDFVALTQHLRPVRRLGGEPDVRDRHHEIPWSNAPGQQSRCGRDLNHYTSPAKTTADPNNRLHAFRLVVSRL
jgi:hypothetical protein